MQQRFCAWVSLIMTTRYTSWQTEERKEKLGKPSAHNNCRTGLTSAKAYVLQTLLAGRVINAMFSQGGSQETSQSVLFDGHGLHFCALQEMCLGSFTKHDAFRERADRAWQQGAVVTHASHKPPRGSRKPGYTAHEGRSPNAQEERTSRNAIQEATTHGESHYQLT